MKNSTQFKSTLSKICTVLLYNRDIADFHYPMKKPINGIYKINSIFLTEFMTLTI